MVPGKDPATKSWCPRVLLALLCQVTGEARLDALDQEADMMPLTRRQKDTGSVLGALTPQRSVMYWHPLINYRAHMRQLSMEEL